MYPCTIGKCPTRALIRTPEKLRRAVKPALGPHDSSGYMAKQVTTRPDWLKADRVVDVYSVSSCVSEDFAEYINYWRHNGYWLFDSPARIQEIARETSLNIINTKLYYYKVHELEYDEDAKSWKAFGPEASFEINIQQPEIKTLQGWDIVTF